MTVTLPETRYARAGDDIRIAYQVHGEGPLDLVAAYGPAAHLEVEWENPALARFFERLGSFARVVRFDRRGTGLSDPTSRPPTLEEYVDDMCAVLEAVGVDRPALYGGGDAGRMCLSFAAKHPERARALVTFGTSARGADVLTPERREAFLDLIDEHWGEGGFLPLFGPSAADDPAFKRWWSRFERAAATHAAARALVEVALQSDVSDLLPHIRAPTLVLHRADDALVDVALGRELAEAIPDARFVELPGIDNIDFLGDSDALLEEVEHFLTGTRRDREPDRALATILLTDIVESTNRAAGVGDRRWRDLLHAHHRIVRAQLERFEGREVNTIGDGFLAIFELPSAAVRCARSIRAGLSEIGLDVRAGLHTGECELIDDDVSGLAVHIAARIGALAGPGEVLVSGTVWQTSAGSEWEFADRGVHRLRGVPGEWRVFAA
jgi:class 3 adenylate cyclase